MDEQLQKALDIANYMTTMASQKQVIFEEYQQQSIYFYNGSTFKVSRELINFVKTLIDLKQTDAVLIDDNNLPVDIVDLKKFLETILNVYTLAVNEFQTKYKTLKSNRSIEGLIDL
jgi:hypothetical protein